MKKTIQNRFMLAALICLLLLSVFLVSAPTASAQSPEASGTSGAETPAPSLPPGVFQGSLPQSNPDTALREAGNKAYDAILHGQDLLKSGHASDAAAEFQHALDYVPTDGLAYQRLAEACVALGKLNEASQAFHKVLIEGFGLGFSGGVGGNADVWAEYSLVLAKTNQPAEAIQMYNHAAFLLDYEDSQYHGGQPILKVPLPEAMTKPASPNQVQYTPERLQALADTALAYGEMGIGSNKEAITHMKEAAKLYPNSGTVQYYLGEALSSSGYVFLDSPVKDKAAAWTAFQEDKKATTVAYKKAAELGDDRASTAAKERLAVAR